MVFLIVLSKAAKTVTRSRSLFFYFLFSHRWAWVDFQRIFTDPRALYKVQCPEYFHDKLYMNILLFFYRTSYIRNSYLFIFQVRKSTTTIFTTVKDAQNVTKIMQNFTLDTKFPGWLGRGPRPSAPTPTQGFSHSQ